MSGAQEGSPCADAGTAGVGVSSNSAELTHLRSVVEQYRRQNAEHERLIGRLYELLPERADDAHDLVRDEYRAIHGPREP